MSAAMAAHLSVVTASSPSLASARQSVIHLYRDFQRGVSHFMTNSTVMSFLGEE
jgi:NADH dehydrogenase (ubiquinone) 1 alpha subcomplex subunit 6